jgi:ribokinase
VVVVVGSANFDFTIKVPRFPQVGETITGGKLITSSGGKGLNQAIASARAGAKTHLICSVGNDILWKQILAIIRKEKNLKVIPFFSKQHTGCAFIIIDENGKNKIFVSPGANLHLKFSLVSRKLKILKPKHIIIQNEIPDEVIKGIIKMKDRFLNSKVFFNAAPYKDSVKEILDRPDFLIVNETEASFIFNRKIENEIDALSVLEDVRKDFKNTIIITLGENGVAFLHNHYLSHIPAFRVQAVDTTSAGDTFIGYLSYALLNGSDINDAIKLAQAASAICVTRYGAGASIPTAREVKNFLKERAQSEKQ